MGVYIGEEEEDVRIFILLFFAILLHHSNKGSTIYTSLLSLIFFLLKSKPHLSLSLIFSFALNTHKQLALCSVLRIEIALFDSLEKVILDNGYIFLVMEYLGTDLLNHRIWCDTKYPIIVRSFLRDLLLGLAFLHSKFVIHRDIKPQNLLIDTTSENHTLKIGDFGHARTPLNPSLTPQVVTLEYRAPEILLGDTRYSKAVDIWAAGCVFGQMSRWKGARVINFDEDTNDDDVAELEEDLSDECVFNVNAKNEEDQIVGIFRLLGTPDDNSWPGVIDLPLWKEFDIFESQELSVLFPSLNQDGLDLLSMMLCLNPANRITAVDALAHPYFTR